MIFINFIEVNSINVAANIAKLVNLSLRQTYNLIRNTSRTGIIWSSRASVFKFKSNNKSLHSKNGFGQITV